MFFITTRAKTFTTARSKEINGCLIPRKVLETVGKKVLNFFEILFSYILQNFLRRSQNLLRSYSGECLGSSSDEERSELRYAIWIAEFRELLDLWTHAAFWGNPVCSVTGVFNSFFRHGLGSWICVLSVLQSLLGTSNASGAALLQPARVCLPHKAVAALV